MSLFSHQNLKSRIWVSVISLLSIFCIVFFAQYKVFHPFFALILCAVTSICLIEFFRMSEAKGGSPFKRTAIFFSCLYIFSSLLVLYMPFWSFLPKLVLIVLLFVIFVRQLQVKTNAIVNLATTCFGVIYISVPLSMILSIVFFHPGEGYEGRWWFLYVLLVTKFSDIGGLFVGSVFGKHKLAAHISPGKTVEGFVGGVICSFCVSLVLWTWWGQSLHFLRMSGLEAVILGLLLPCIGQIGDLAESLLKRDANVKDSNSLPGMGGVLDMVDSLLFTIPTVYVFLKL